MSYIHKGRSSNASTQQIFLSVKKALDMVDRRICVDIYYDLILKLLLDWINVLTITLSHCSSICAKILGRVTVLDLQYNMSKFLSDM